MCKTLLSKKSHSVPGNSHASNSNVTFDAGLISVGAKEPSSEQHCVCVCVCVGVCACVCVCMCAVNLILYSL